MVISLRQICSEHQGKVSDKWTGYISRYEDLFTPYRGEPISLLEIGVQNGGSLEIWAKCFRKASHIVGIDINPKCGKLVFDDPCIQVVVGDATKHEIQSRVAGNFDIIIDDGSHRDADIISGFTDWFKRLNVGGFYIVEDMHSCKQSVSTNGVNYFIEISKQLAHNNPVVPEGVYSVEFLNSLVIVHKQLPKDCGPGTRFTAGQIEAVVGGHKHRRKSS